MENQAGTPVPASVSIASSSDVGPPVHEQLEASQPFLWEGRVTLEAFTLLNAAALDLLGQHSDTSSPPFVSFSNGAGVGGKEGIDLG